MNFQRQNTRAASTSCILKRAKFNATRPATPEITSSADACTDISVVIVQWRMILSFVKHMNTNWLATRRFEFSLIWL